MGLAVSAGEVSCHNWGTVPVTHQPRFYSITPLDLRDCNTVGFHNYIPTQKGVMQMTKDHEPSTITPDRKNVPLDADLHRQLKVLAAQWDKPMSVFLDQFVRAGLKASENHKDGDAV